MCNFTSRNFFFSFSKAAQAIADGETSDGDLIKDIPELQDVDRKEASKRSFCILYCNNFSCLYANVCSM